MKSSMFTGFLIGAFCFFLFTPSHGQIQFQGQVKGSAFGMTEAFDYSSAFAELGLQPSYQTGNTSVFADLRVRAGNQYDQVINLFQLKEAYARYQGSAIDITLGKQIIKWGRTDGFNPTSYLSAQDYFLLSADPDDQSIGTFMLTLNYRLSSTIDIELVGVPIYQPSVYRYDLFDFGETASLGTMQLPEKTFANGSVAGRLNFELPALGFSISGFHGYDPFYGLAAPSIDWATGQPLIEYSARPYKKTSLGADISLPLGSVIVRGEAAWNKTDASLALGNVPNDHLYYVGGVEASIAGVMVIAQYIGRYDLEYTDLEQPLLLDPTDPLQMMAYTNQMILFESAGYNRNIFQLTEKVNHGAAVTLRKSFGYDLVTVELTGYYQLATEEYLIRPKLAFRLSDGLNLAVGGQYMNGPEGSVFDQAGRIMSGAFLELKASF